MMGEIDPHSASSVPFPPPPPQFCGGGTAKLDLNRTPPKEPLNLPPELNKSTQFKENVKDLTLNKKQHQQQQQNASSTNNSSTVNNMRNNDVTTTTSYDSVSDSDRSMQDSGIFTIDSLVTSPEPPILQMSPELAVKNLTSPGCCNNTQRMSVKGEESSSISLSSGITKITIVCSTENSTKYSYSSSGGESNACKSSASLSESPLPPVSSSLESSSVSPASASSSSPLSISSDVSPSNSSSSLLSSDNGIPVGHMSHPALPLGGKFEGNFTRGRIAKKTKKHKDDTFTADDHSKRRRSRSQSRVEKKDQTNMSNGQSTVRIRNENRKSSRSGIVPLPSTSYPTNYRHKSSSSNEENEHCSIVISDRKLICNDSNVESSGHLSIDSSKDSHSNGRPISHASKQPPICNSCFKKGITFFNVNCDNCWHFLKRGNMTPSQIFAVLRVWDARVQRNIGPLVGLAVRGGCGINDRDSVTDMTLLHYAVKAGARGLGDPTIAVQVVEELVVVGGADVQQRCRWTHMTALHYAAFFDVPLVLDMLLADSNGVAIDDPCVEYDGGSPLHMAASNLCLTAATLLVHNGANRRAKDNKGRTPTECIPESEQYKQIPDVQEIIYKLQILLNPNHHNHHITNGGGETGIVHAPSGGSGNGGGKAVLLSMGLKVGDRVLVNGVKTGVLRFAGCTEFAVGLWAGVELEVPEGRHNGTVRGVVYFRCANNYGLFVPVVRLTKIPNVARGRLMRRHRAPSQGRNVDRSHSRDARQQRIQRDSQGNSTVESRGDNGRQKLFNGRRSLSLPPGRVNHGKVDVSKISSRVAQDINDNTRRIFIGDRVVVDLRVKSETHSCSPQRPLKGITKTFPTSSNQNCSKLDPATSADISPDSSNFYISSNSLTSPSNNNFSFSIGLESLSSKQAAIGTVRFTGMVAFASGYWVGIELDEAIGSNDGSVNGTRYFDSRTKHGIFAAPSRISKVNDADLDRSTLSFPYEKYFHYSTNNIHNNKSNSSLIDDSFDTNKENYTTKNIRKKKNYVKSRVDCGQLNKGKTKKENTLQKNYATNVTLKKTSNENGLHKTNKFKMNKSVGSIYNSSDDQYNSNGSGMNPKYGIRGSRRIDITSNNNNNNDNNNNNNSSYSNDRIDACLPFVLPNPVKNSSLKNEFYPTNTSMSNLNKSFSARYISSRMRQEEFSRRRAEALQQPQWQEQSSRDPEVRYNPHHYKKEHVDTHWLDVGCNVFYKGKIGIVKYLGPVDFELGTWLGIELRAPDGRHDGYVLGRRYFTCRYGHGLMVRPCNVTVRGLNGGHVVRNDQEDEEYDEAGWV